MLASDLRIALFSGNYNYVRDGANQALNRVMGSAFAAGAHVRVYSPTTDTPAFAPTGDLVSVPSWSLPGGRGEYRLAKGLSASVRADLAMWKPNIVHVSAPDILGHRAATWARRQGIPCIASLHTRFETYPHYYGLGFIEPLLVWMQKRFYNRVDRVMVPSPSMKTLLEQWGVTTPIGIWSRGINHARFNPGRRDNAWRRSLGIGDDEVAVGFLGRLVLEKGLGVFADVIGQLRARGVPHRVLVIGEGPARDWFADRVPEAVSIAENWAKALAYALVQTCRVIDADRIVLGGSVAQLYPLVAARLAAHMQAAQDMNFPLPNVQLNAEANFGPAFGAACMLHQRYLSLESNRFSEED